VFQNLVKGAEK